MTAGLETKFLKAKRAESRGDEAEARRLFQEVLSRHPNNRKALSGLERLDNTNGGAAPALQAGIDRMLHCYTAQDYAGVVAVGEPLVERFPRAANIANLLGAAYLSMDDMPNAERAFRHSIAADAAHQPSHNNLGIVLKRLGQVEEAERAFLTAVDLDPKDREARFNIAALYRDQKRLEKASAAFAALLELQPHDVEARYWLGNGHRNNGELDQALSAYLQAIAQKPDYFPAIFGLGHVLLDMGQYDSAVDVYHQATLVEPNNVRAHFHLGSLQKLLGKMDKARSAYASALAINPGDNSLRAHLSFQDAVMADWTKRADFASLPFDNGAGLEPVEPFIALTFEDDGARQLRRSEILAKSLPAATMAPGDFPKPPAGRKIRIGYFSADFHNHATLHLLAGLLREHDRERFEIRAYSFGTLSGAMRDAVMPYFDSFTDIRLMDDEKAVQLARQDGLDIAIDLKGYTRDNRMGLFSRRMAPVQIAYIGYPGSVGGAEVDYIIADKVVIPEGHEHYYSERVIRIPGSYQANDNQRPIGSCPDDRTALGLPAEGFVFCSFNQSYKIGPREYDIWMRLLHQVEGSVLWLIKSNEWSDDNLRKEAAARGIDPARIIFADKLDHADHLARQRHADLFLDTFAVNAHTTASDALWGGLPVLTLVGHQFAARVAASLLAAIDLPELITGTEADYEAMALDLARSPEKLAALKAKVSANRLTAPLFDTVAQTRAIEAAYAATHQRWLDGLAPDHIDID